MSEIHNAFEKCSNYSVLSILTMSTLSRINRFKSIPKDKVITMVYNKIKERAGKKTA